MRVLERIVSRPSTRSFRDNFDRTFRGRRGSALVGYPDKFEKPLTRIREDEVDVLIKTIDGDISLRAEHA